MRIQSIFLLIISITLVTVSSWLTSILFRLENASTHYDSDTEMLYACNISKYHVKYEKTVSIITLLISIILMFISSYNIYSCL